MRCKHRRRKFLNDRLKKLLSKFPSLPRVSNAEIAVTVATARAEIAIAVSVEKVTGVIVIVVKVTVKKANDAIVRHVQIVNRESSANLVKLVRLVSSALIAHSANNDPNVLHVLN